jgi:four helix bundle protein
METENTKNGTFFRFEDLRVYHKALDYIDWVYEVANEVEGNASRILVERFINSAQAIAFYIAEGSARNKSQFVYYLKMAKSAVRECVVITTIAEKNNLLDGMKVDESRNELMELTKMIGALIGSLQKTNGKGKNRQNGKNHDENEVDGNRYDYNLNDNHEYISSDSIDINKY